MVFSSTIFLYLFLPFFLITYWLTPSKYRNWTALIWSVLFYIWGAPKFIIVLAISIVLDFFLAKAIYNATEPDRKKLLLLSIALNAGLLFFFKYANFFTENVNELLQMAGATAVHWTKLALPIGISFFTFQKLSYVVDVYRGKHQPLDKISDLALYIMLFPQLIAGPIVRYNEIDTQIRDRSDSETVDNFLNGMFRFTIGLSKKMLIANPMAEVADYIFNEIPGYALTMGQAWLGSLAYAFQIYFDFSGYSDMAIGLGLMMGFKFPENFNAPYIAQNITEFWRRWHITLSNWMRDYLYIPLGGNRVSTTRLYINLWIVFLFSGLWHGAAWTFIFWGIFHGAFLVLDRLFLIKMFKGIGKPLRILITFIFVLIGWVIFRSGSMEQAWNFIFIMFNFTNIDLKISIVEGTHATYLQYKYVWLLIAATLFSFLPAFKWWETRMNLPLTTNPNLKSTSLKWLFTAVMLFLCMTEVLNTGTNPFIYYRF